MEVQLKMDRRASSPHLRRHFTAYQMS